ncbi:MAG TPA: NrfD/PsrC family molybdoenzyme membrane anchor subunit [Gemmatimonadales bacterium]|nr:NrfD/PsrC family molybdoenzyme membrane anchor subunit [Gemmatimonadales bacterium]
MTAADAAVPPAPPVKPAAWEWYIPIYFWAGGIAAGSWLAFTAEQLAGDGDSAVVRAGRYLALGGVLGGTVLLIVDLGRPDRFLNMLRIVRARSTMSLGAWGLALFGGLTGVAGLLQAAEDGWLGRQPALARLSRGSAGRALHLLGLPAALFVGGYTGVLLETSSTPAWSRQARRLGPLFLASAVSSGLAAVDAVVGARNGVRPKVRRRLARAGAAALAAELALELRSHAAARTLPSIRRDGLLAQTARAVTIGAGIAAPLALALGRSRARRNGRARLGDALVLAGSLGLRFLVTREGLRSARTPADTWQLTGRTTARLQREGACAPR